MGSLAPFLPPHLVHSLARRGLPHKLPHVERFRCALLLADVSGFTALTERLQLQGREGAEEIAATIDAAFAPAIRAIEGQGGSIVSFGGDALFAMFRGASPVRRAWAASEAIHAAFAARGEVATSVGPVVLSVSQAVHHGEVSSVHLGSPRCRTYIVTGAAVRELTRLQARAGSGATRLSVAARRQQGRERAARPRAGSPARAAAASLRPYLAPRLIPHLAGFEGEYRRVALLFLETRGDRPVALQRFQLTLVEILDRTEGVLLKTDVSRAGTKWLCVFGIPGAHEDDPDRCARAALELGKHAGVRGGIHSGTVANIVVGTTGRRSFDVMGDVVNTAARAMTEAAWGEVLVTDEAVRLLTGVRTGSRGARSVRGKARPLELHALEGVKPRDRRRDATPMIGRDAELREIVGALQEAIACRGAVVGIRGEPGLGKSRLQQEAARVASEMGLHVHEGRARSFGGLAYGAIGTLLRDCLEIPEVCDGELVLERVAAAAPAFGLSLVDRHHLADVLGARYEGSPIQHLPPKDVRLNAMIAIRNFGQAIARSAPRLLVLDDMQWADAMTREAARWLAAAAGGSAFVLLLLFRPGYEPPAQARVLRLGELGPAAVDELLRATLGAVPAKVARLVRDRVGGNPFYVEELTRHLLESGLLTFSDEGYQLVRDPRPEDLPGSVESVIAARLDRLAPDVRKVAQVGAVIGRTFQLELLANLEQTAKHATQAVSDLEARELIQEKAREPRLEYIFRQALTRDVAYGSILAARRRRIHEAVAAAIEELYPAERASFLAVLGHHRELAGQPAPARAAYLEAARVCAACFAHEEAERLYRSCIALCPTPTSERVTARHELGRVLESTGRVAEALDEQQRAHAEAAAFGDPVLAERCLAAVANTQRMLGRLEEAFTTSGCALAMARARADASAECHLLANIAILELERGKTREARETCESALALCRSLSDRKQEASALGTLAGILHLGGDVELALQTYTLALAGAREVGGRRMEAQHLGNVAIIHHQHGRVDEARAMYEHALSVLRELGNRRVEGGVIGNLAILHAEQGRHEEARLLHERALAIHREVGDRRLEGGTLGNLALLRYGSGDHAGSQELHLEALAIAREVGDPRLEGQLLGNLASLTVMTGRTGHAREIYEQALALARKVGDRRLEGIHLRSIASMARLAGDIPAATGLLDRSEVLLADVRDSVELGKLHVERGHTNLAAGTSAAFDLDRARAMAAQMGAREESELGQLVAKLARAQNAFEIGQPLLRGAYPEDLPPEVRREVE